MSIEARQQEAMSIATRAVELARQYRHEMVTLEHVLMALLETEEVQTCLNQLQVDIAEIGNTIQTFMTGDFIDKNDHGRPIKTIAFETLFVRAVASGLFSARKTVTAVDILLHMLQYPHEDNFAVSTLLRANLNSTMLKRFLSHGVAGATSSPMGTTPGMAAAGAEAGTAEPEPGSRDEAIKFIKKFATNLNEEALAGKIDPIIGRAVELDNTVQILARRTKNNLIYVGEPGTGKTACAEGLAYNITKGDVPTILKNATVWSLDIGNLVAGTRFRGDLEERMKIFLKCMTFLSEPLPESDPNSPAINILFIDEMHTVMEAGSGSKGSLDVANMLKPALAKGTLRCIGSTTYEEYRKHFEKDRALSRRFKKIQIDEPSPELTKKILRGLRGLYEAFHGVTYTDAALDAAVDLTHRYVHTALLPDKAIDIIDQAGSRQRITPEDQRLVIIDVEQIEAEVSKIAKIPSQNITETESDKLQRLESDLASKVFGQEKALTALNDAVIISRSGLREPNLPAGAYLLTGSSGVGKCLGYNQKLRVKIPADLLKIINSMSD
jgi:ATP-dependent Clp protease ATP-binding subunit ClpA